MPLDRIFYYRYAYSPVTADVTLSHNHEGHNIRLHSDLANERPERDLLYGYAIRTPLGWNIYDEDDKAVDDPNINYSVRKAIEDGT